MKELKLCKCGHDYNTHPSIYACGVCDCQGWNPKKKRTKRRTSPLMTAIKIEPACNNWLCRLRQFNQAIVFLDEDDSELDNMAEQRFAEWRDL